MDDDGEFALTWAGTAIVIISVVVCVLVMFALAKHDLERRALDRADDVCYDHCYPFVHRVDGVGDCWCADLGQDIGDNMHPSGW